MPLVHMKRWGGFSSSFGRPFDHKRHRDRDSCTSSRSTGDNQSGINFICTLTHSDETEMPERSRLRFQTKSDSVVLKHQSDFVPCQRQFDPQTSSPGMENRVGDNLLSDSQK